MPFLDFVTSAEWETTFLDIWDALKTILINMYFLYINIVYDISTHHVLINLYLPKTFHLPKILLSIMDLKILPKPPSWKNPCHMNSWNVKSVCMLYTFSSIGFSSVFPQ